MSAYRFCRSDDIALLVQAYNACYLPHFPQLPQMTVEGFKRLIRSIDVWTSSCMVAFSGRQPIGVLLAAKREAEGQSLITHVGVHPDHCRKGHGRHLMTSLSAKLSILGPPRLLCEVPVDQAPGRAFVEACGYAVERSYTDYAAERRAGDARAGALAATIAVEDLLASGGPDAGTHLCWERSLKTLANRRRELHGLAIAGAERIEAYLVWADGEPREILALGAADPARGETWLRLLLDAATTEDPASLRIAKVDRDELPPEWLEALGFRAAGKTLLYAADARPA